MSVPRRIKDLESLYESFEQVEDLHTRNVLYTQFLQKYFPKAVAALEYMDNAARAIQTASVQPKDTCPGTPDGLHEWQDASKNTIMACRACGKLQ